MKYFLVGVLGYAAVCGTNIVAATNAMLEDGIYENTAIPDNCHKIKTFGSYLNWAVEMRYGYSCDDFRFSMTWICVESVCKETSINGTPVSGNSKYYIAQDGRSFLYDSGSQFVLIK